MYRKLEDEKNAAASELVQQNSDLYHCLSDASNRENEFKKELQSLRDQCSERKNSMYTHFTMLDSLRQEVD